MAEWLDALTCSLAHNFGRLQPSSYPCRAFLRTLKALSWMRIHHRAFLYCNPKETFAGGCPDYATLWLTDIASGALGLHRMICLNWMLPRSSKTRMQTNRLECLGGWSNWVGLTFALKCQCLQPTVHDVQGKGTRQQPSILCAYLKGNPRSKLVPCLIPSQCCMKLSPSMTGQISIRAARKLFLMTARGNPLQMACFHPWLVE